SRAQYSWQLRRRRRRGAGSLSEGAAQHLQFSRAVQLRRLDVSHFGEHVLRRAPQPPAQERSLGARRGRRRRNSVAGAASAGGASVAAPRAGAGAGHADAASARRFSFVRGGRISPRGNFRDAGNYRGGLEEHTFPGEEKSSSNVGTSTRQRCRGSTVKSDERNL